jgi:hypothetical protein
LQMTLSIICAYIGCWAPYFVVHLIHIWSEYKYFIPDFVYVSAETVTLVNSAVNPILYGCFNLQLKRGLVEVCCRGQSSLGGTGSAVSVRSLRYQLSEFGQTPTITTSRRTLSSAARRVSARRGLNEHLSTINASANRSSGYSNRQSPVTTPTAPVPAPSSRLFRRSQSVAAAGMNSCAGTDATWPMTANDPRISFISSASLVPRTTAEFIEMERSCSGFKLRVKFERANSPVETSST